MPIPVICPGCKTAFQVSEKFAGKKGPCPKCKAVITIPEATPEIVIHAPKPEGPVDSTGRPVFSPILREETKVSQTALFAMAAAVIMVLLVAVVMGLASPGGPPLQFLIVGAIALAPPLGIAGYALFRDQEMTPYRGTTLWIRVAASSVVYALLWAVYVWLLPWVYPPLDGPPYAIYALIVIVPVIMAIGGLTAYVSYDLEFGQAVMHYGLYLAATVILSWLAGVNWLPSDM